MSSIISAGNSVINRASTRLANTTHIDKLVPITGDGFLNEIKAWSSSSITNFKVAVFRFVSGTTYKCVALSSILGTVTSGAERTFNLSVPLFVKAGDFIGCHFTAGSIEADTSGGSLSSLAGDNTVVGTSYNFTTNNAYVLSLKATGVTNFSSTFRNYVQPEISSIVENGTGILPVEVVLPLPPGTSNTPFTRSVQSGTNINIIAPLNYDGMVFGFWRIIKTLTNDETIFDNNELDWPVTEPIEVRAVYFKQMLRNSVEYVIGPIYLNDDNVSSLRETVEYV
jgi:hypothetical protein